MTARPLAGTTRRRTRQSSWAAFPSRLTLLFLCSLAACGKPTDAPTGSLRLAAVPSLVECGVVTAWVESFRAERGIDVAVRAALRSEARVLATAGDVDLVIAEAILGEGAADAVPGVDRREIAWTRLLLFEPAREEPTYEAVRMTATVAAVHGTRGGPDATVSSIPPHVAVLDAVRVTGLPFVLALPGSSARSLVAAVVGEADRPVSFIEAPPGERPIHRAREFGAYGACDEIEWRRHADAKAQRVLVGGGARMRNSIVAVLVRPVTGPAAKTEPARRFFDFLVGPSAAAIARATRVRGARVLWIGDEAPVPIATPFSPDESGASPAGSGR